MPHAASCRCSLLQMHLTGRMLHVAATAVGARPPNSVSAMIPTSLAAVLTLERVDGRWVVSHHQVLVVS